MTPTTNPPATPHTNIPALRSIALRLPFFFILTLLGVAIVATTSITNIIRTQSLALVESNLATIAQNEAQQISRLLHSQIAFLASFTNDESIQIQLRTSNFIFEDTLKEPQEIAADWQIVWTEALLQDSTAPTASPFVQAVLSNSLSEELNRRPFAEPAGQDGVIVVNRYGALLGSNYVPSLYDYSQTSWFQGLQDGSEVYLSGRALDRHAPTTTITEIALPILDEATGEVLGYIRGAFSFDYLKEILEQGRFNQTGRVALRDGAGDITYSLTLNNSIGPYRLGGLAESQMSEIAQFVSEEGDVYFISTAAVESNTAAVQALNWYVSAYQPTTDALAPINTAIPRAITTSAVFSILAVALLYSFYIRPLTNDLGKLRGQALALQEQGDTSPLILGREDELGVLAGTFNQMANRIRRELLQREEIIAQRTAELERRATQMESTMLIGRVASSSLNLETLMADVVNLIRDRADYYHASIFLLDATGQYAVVRESTGEVGKILKERPHKLAVGSNSIVGQATQRRESFLARNVGEEFSFFNNPLLPETKSEVALPLLYQGELLGALDVQSRRLDAFTTADLTVLQLMADQVAAAIANARLYTATLDQGERQRQVIQLWKQLDGLKTTADILHTLCQSLVKEFGYDGAYVAELRHSEMTLVASAAREARHHVRLGLVRPITERGPVATALAQHTPLLIPHKEPNQPHSYDLDFMAVQSEVLAPIYVPQGITRLLSVYSNTPNQLQANDRNLVELIAEAVGAALYNTQLHTEQERNLREINHLYQQTVQSSGQETAIREQQYIPAKPATASLSWEPHIIPLVVRDQVLGELVVESQRPWDDEEPNLIQAVADQTAYALENSRLFAQTQLRLREQAALFELTNSLTATLDVQEIYRRATQAFTEQLNLGRCTLATWEKPQNSLTVRTEYVRDPENPSYTGHYTRFEVRPAAEYPAAEQALRTGQTISRTLAAADLSTAEQKLFKETGQTTSLEIPLVANQMTLGLVSLYRPTLGGFNAAETRLAQAMASQTASALQNGLLAERTRTQVTQLSSLNRLSRQLTLANSLRDVFETVRHEVLSLTHSTGMAISLITPDNKVQWTYAYEYGEENDVTVVPPQEMNVGFTGHVLTTREPLLLNKYTNIEEMMRKMRSIQVGAPPNAWLGVPMFALDKLIGALVIENGDDPNAFGENEVQLLTTVSSTVAIAISNLRQVTEISSQRQEAERLYVTGQRIGTAVTSAEILAALAESGLLPQVRAMAIYTFNETNENLAVYARWEIKAGEFGSLCQLDQQLSAEDWPFLAQLSQTTPLHYTDTTADETLDATSRRLLRQHNAYSAAFLPLAIGQTWLGVLALYGSQPRTIEANSIPLINSLTSQIGATVQNRRLLRQTQASLVMREEQSLQLQTAAEVAAAASASGLQELTILFQTAVDLIQDRFGLYYVGLFLADESQQVVRLVAGTGEEGAAQIAAKRQLPIGGNSLVGNTSVDGQPRIRQNVYDAPDWLPNPFLPHTRSEIALALRVRGRNIGALTVQSATFHAFSDELVRALQTMSDQIAIAIDNAYLFEQVQTNLGRANALYQASQKLITADEAEVVFDVLLTFAEQSGLFQFASVSIPDPHSTQYALMVKTWNFGQPDLLPRRFQMVTSVPAMRDAPYLILNDDNERLLWGPEVQEWLDENGTRSGCVVRLMANERWVATLGLGRTTNDPITETDIQPFLALADQATVVLANQQLLKETSALYRLGRSLSSAITQEDVAQVTIDEIARYTGIEQGRVIFFNAKHGRATLVAAQGLPASALGSWELAVADDPTLAKLKESKEPLWIMDSGEEMPSTAVLNYLRPWNLRAALLLPAISQGEVTGIVTLDSRSDERIFTRDNITFAQAAVAQFTTTIENIIFFDEALRRAQELITLNQISARISGTLNAEDLAEIVYGEVARLMEPAVFMLAEYSPHDLHYKPLIFTLHGRRVAVPSRHMGKHHPLYETLFGGEALVLTKETELSRALFELLGQPLAEAGADGHAPQSSVFIPMLQEGRPRGFLAVQALPSNDYTSEQINLLRAISSQTVLGLSNARLFRETQENVAELRTQFNITQSIASSIDANLRIARMVESLHTNLREARVAVLLYQEGEIDLQVLGAHGYDAPPSFSTKTGLVGKVIQYNTPLLMNDLRELGEEPPADTLSQLAVPLVLGQRVIGVLNVESNRTDAFTERDLRLLQTLSVSLAATIESGRLFNEIQSANEQLRELDKMKTQFLANMSHELRTPLNSIIGFSRLILKGIDGPINPMQEEDLSSIYNSGQHLLNLINDILDLAKMDAGKMALVFDKVDLNQLCQSVLGTAKGLLKSEAVQLVWQIQPDLPQIEADPVRMRQILLNLLSNAAKFTDQGSITLHIAQSDDAYIQIAVRDTGIGIAEQDFPRLFQAFEQVDSSDSRKVGGTGLGLPIVHELVLMHGGQIWLESQLGRGATFYVRLPIYQKEIGVNDMMASGTAEKEKANSFIAPAPPPPQRPAIVLIDDEEGMLTLYQRYLNTQPFELLCFTTGEQALTAVRQRPQDIALVVVDDELPDMSGWDMWQALREDTQLHRVPIALCTLHNSSGATLPDNRTFILTKPIIADDLLAVMGALEEVG